MFKEDTDAINGQDFSCHSKIPEPRKCITILKQLSYYVNKDFINYTDSVPLLKDPNIPVINKLVNLESYASNIGKIIFVEDVNE